MALRCQAVFSCVASTRTLPIAGGRHEPADAHAFERALQALEWAPDPGGGQATCRARRARVIEREAARITALVDAGELGRARPRLRALEARWGGLARPAAGAIAAHIARPMRPAAQAR